MLFVVNTSLKNVEARMINERKINVKAILDFDIKLFKNSNEEFITGIKDVLDLQKREENIKVNSLLGTAKTKAQRKHTKPCAPSAARRGCWWASLRARRFSPPGAWRRRATSPSSCRTAASGIFPCRTYGNKRSVNL